MVEKIWEGTVTVLSLDIVRAAAKPGVLQAFISVRNHAIVSYVVMSADYYCDVLVGRERNLFVSATDI